MKSLLKGVLLASLILFSRDLSAADAGWFTDVPSDRGMLKKMRFAHGGPVEMGRGGLYIKRLWLRSGASPGSSEYRYLSDNDAAEALLHLPGGGTSAVPPFKDKHGYGFRFEMPEEGFYNLYLVERSVDGDTLNIVVTKAEVLKHSCAKGHDHVSRKMQPRSMEDIPFEIVRERIDGEDFHTHISSGDELTYRVLYKGEPAVDADVEFITEKGWVKRAGTDLNGSVKFELIRDHYPSSWSRFEKRKSEDSVVTASYTVSEEGVYNNKPFSRIRYTTTLSGKFYPAEEEYTSYLYGLVVILFTFAFAAAGIYIHRNRGERPYREESFAEGD